jgi:arylsulfatase A-like enzyme
MRIYLRTAPSWLLLGALVGAAIGLFQASEVWPRLSQSNVAHRVAMGWLIALIASPLVAVIVARRSALRLGGPTGPWRRAGRAALGVIAIAPAAIWLNSLAPSPVGPELARVGRPIGDTRPNIVLISIDALRPDHLGAYGGPPGLTPNLDAFAKEAALYNAAYAAAPWTLPSFGTIFTSRPPSECGLKSSATEGCDWYTHRARLPESVPLLSERLHDAGYVTAAELTNPFLAEQRGWARGFDYFRNEDIPNVHTLVTSRTARAETVTENARLWLRLNARGPFFLWVHYLDPHAPYDSPETPSELRARYPDEWDTGWEYWCDHREEMPRDVQMQYAEFRRAMYAEEVRYADRWFGALMKDLRRTAGYQRSLVIVTSDHGEELFEHEGFDHGHSMHEELLWVPLLVKWPEGRGRARRVGTTVGLIDLAPTILEIAGAQPLDGARGRVLPMRDGEPGDHVYSEAVLHGAEQTALTTAELKVICRPSVTTAAPTFEVYDRRRDRDEQHDMSGLSAAADLTERLWALTEAARQTAVRWHSGLETADAPLGLDAATERKLQALGYLGR